ncbi:MAG: L-2-hydroxyglutarate oxidase, partial [Dehalococcoidia bacterium]
MTDYKFDVTVVGGGIIGVATAMRLASSHPKLKVGVVEKEAAVAGHQTGHNSGVIHSGIYYAPGSLKAKNCVTGARDLMAFCDENNIPYELCGKLIIATSDEELPRLDELFRRGTANGVPGLEMIGPERVKEIEPEASAVRGLLSPRTGIIDYTQVTKAYARQLQEHGGTIVFNARVNAIHCTSSHSHLETEAGDVETKYLINCAGLYADKIATMMGLDSDVRIIPFRGEYYFLRPEARRLVKGLIYPVPNPEFPFLGVHFTRSIHGGVEAGPNAVLATAREGYTKLSFNPLESAWTLSYPGFWQMARKYWKTGMHEVYRSLSKKAFAQALQR